MCVCELGGEERKRDRDKDRATTGALTTEMNSLLSSSVHNTEYMFFVCLLLLLLLLQDLLIAVVALATRLFMMQTFASDGLCIILVLCQGDTTVTQREFPS